MSALALIANPAAGGGRCGDLLDGTVATLKHQGHDVRVIRTARPGHATDIARELVDAGHRELLVAGGDGTVFEVVNGIQHIDEPVTLGILPLGTGNSFLRDFDLTSADGTLEAMARGRTRTVDLIECATEEGGFVYLNILSFGFTSEVGALTNRRFKPLGAHGYTVATVVEVCRLQHHHFRYQLDDGPVIDTPCTFLSFNNSQFTGGTMHMAPDADPTDGQLDALHIGALGRLELLATFPRIYSGTHLESPKHTAQRAREVRFHIDHALDLMVDGEIIRARPLSLKVRPGALRIWA